MTEHFYDKSFHVTPKPRWLWIIWIFCRSEVTRRCFFFPGNLKLYKLGRVILTVTRFPQTDYSLEMWGNIGSLTKTRGSETDPLFHLSVSRRQQ